MVMTTDKYIERLFELHQKKKELLSDILDFTQKQTDMIAEDGLDSLGNLIEEKQQKINAIDKLDEEFEIYFQRLKTAMGISKLEQIDEIKLGASAATGARQLKSLTAEILDIIRRINEIEQLNSEKSKKLLDEFGKEIRNINQGKKVSNAYKPTPISSPSYFLDKKN